MCSLSYHSLNSASSSGAMFIAFSNSPPASAGGSWSPGRIWSPSNRSRRSTRAVTRLDHGENRNLQHGDGLEIVGRDRAPAVLSADPALAQQKTRHALPFRQVLGVVPVVELVLGGPPDVHRRDQRAFRHWLNPPRPHCNLPPPAAYHPGETTCPRKRSSTPTRRSRTPTCLRRRGSATSSSSRARPDGIRSPERSARTCGSRPATSWSASS